MAKNANKSTPKLSAKEALKYYEDMLLIRRFEERSGQLYGMGLIAGFCHLYIGQEAVVVGMQAAQKEDDAVITAYRDHGHMLACGMDPKGVMAELTGREGGLSKGKGGSMHMFSREKNFFGGHGIVGAQIPLGAGMALAQKYRKTKDCTVAYMGDGAANQGQVYEAFNMASLWKLPVVFIVENNEYAMGTATHRHSASKNFACRGEPWQIPGRVVDGMDVMAVREAGLEALEHARSGKGPVLLEIKTYRYRGHSMSDPAKYRTKEEVEEYKTKLDPIETFKNKIIKDKLVKEDEIKEIDTRIKELMKEVVEFAKENPEPDASELYTDILIETE